MKLLCLFLLLIAFSLQIFADEKYDEQLKKLIVRAKVLEAKTDFSDERMPRCDLKIETTFTNESVEPIIILLPAEKQNGISDFMFSAGISIFGKNENGNYLIQNNGTLPSICTGCNENIGKILDQETPPDKYTKILKPNESFILIDDATFGMRLKTSDARYGWDEIKNNNWKIYGRIFYSMFPINLGKYGKNFGHKLQKRWMKHGILYVSDIHSLIKSEEFEMDLSNVKF